ncbi:transposase [Labilibaculum filiforme]|nr:transposase [Labilibaculum filiforme]
MKKFQNKYRIPSARAVWWNYFNEGRYYVTICSHNRQWFFGSISDQKMELSSIGKLAHQFWFGIPDHFPFVKWHAFVVMPNHVHGIIEISNAVDVACNVSTLQFISHILTIIRVTFSLFTELSSVLINET